MQSAAESQPLLAPKPKVEHHLRKNTGSDEDEDENYYSATDLKHGDEDPLTSHHHHHHHQDSEEVVEVPPEPPTTATGSAAANAHSMVSSLDFERIVNQYSIQAVRDQLLLPALPVDGSSVSSARKRHGHNEGTSGEIIDDDEAWEPPRKRKTMKWRRRHKDHLWGYSGRTVTRWFLSALAGLLTGLTSILIVQISGTLVNWRSQNLQKLIISPEYTDTFVFGVFSTLNLLAALLAAWLCVGWVPQASGSGIPQVKAYLNGIRGNEKFTRLPLFFVKVVGTILSVSSSLAVGQEGPLIHIGAIMGSGCSKISGVASQILQKCQQWFGPGGACYCGGCLGCCCGRAGCCWRSSNSGHYYTRGPTLVQKLLTWTTSELSHFATDAERRDLVSIGASCGFAASFGAPVGGLLFILDDISSYFSKPLILRILVANAIGTFCLAIQHHDLSNYSVINLGTYTEASNDIFINRVEEIPLYIFVGVMGGILGGLFCKWFMFLRRNITGKYPPPGQGRAKYELLEVALVSVLTSLLIFYIPSHKWACKSHPLDDTVDTDFEELATGFTPDHRRRFFCGEGQINELANMLFGSRIVAIKRILTDPTQFKIETLLVVGMLFYFLMTLTFGISIPSGIFTPTVLIGASLGGAAGILFQQKIDEEINPSTFALLGVAALLAGVQRSTVSVAVILVEGTGQIKVLLPAIITVVVARYVAQLIYEKGVFEAVLEWKNVPYLSNEENKRRYDAIEVADILMDCPVVSVSPREKACNLVHLLETSAHNGYPVIESESKKFLGLVRRDQICALLECGVFDKSLRDSSVTPAWTRPQSGVGKTPLMRWAYHINDDRYDYVRQWEPTQPETHKTVERAPRFSMISSPNLQLAAFSPLPTEFATVALNESGGVYVAWLNPDYENHWVNIGAVMNRGAFCVPEYCPVSKAYKLFTSMGLRHIVVLGGYSGGEVVGMVSRTNLLPAYIKEKTGV